MTTCGPPGTRRPPAPCPGRTAAHATQVAAALLHAGFTGSFDDLVDCDTTTPLR